MSATKTVFYDTLVEFGGTMEEYDGWYWAPGEFPAGAVAEHVATREMVTVCDYDFVAQFAIAGKEVLAFVQHLFTTDLSTLDVGAIRYAAMCDTEGGMIDDGTVWHTADDEYVFMANERSNFDWLREEAGSFDVAVTDLTSERTILTVQGPRSLDLLRKCTNASLGDLPYCRFMPVSIAGVLYRVGRIGFTGGLGYEVHFESDQAQADHVWRALLEAGEPLGVLPAGMGALDSLRLEAGFIIPVNEYDRTTTPFEAGIGQTVSLDKKAFNGKEALTRVLETGLEQLPIWLRLADDAVLATGDAVVSGEKQIGTVTSACFSPTFGCGIAAARVVPRYAIPGEVFGVRGAGGEHSARLSTAPLYRSPGLRGRVDAS